jgi:two-component system cell cycle sensor histidine kinase/response regulator CckA
MIDENANTKVRIMIVEDELIVAQNLENQLKKLGYEVAAAVGSGQEAVKMAAEMKPDLVLMDIKLSGAMDGIDTADQIHTRFQIPVVYLTAYADDETLERAKTTAPFGYILKPFELKKLHSTIEIALYKHQLEKKLRESELRFRTLANSSPVGIFQTDARGNCIYVNKRWCEMAGLSSEQALRMVWVDAVHPRDRSAISWAWVKMTRSGDEFEQEFRFYTPAGKTTWVFGHAAALKSDSGEYMGYIGTITDITVRKKLEDELLTSKKLESIGILAGGIAHDFNNLLSVIMGTISLVKEEPNITEGQYELLTSVERTSAQASELAQKLITFSRGGWLNLKKVSIREVLEDVIHENFAAPDTQFKLDLPPNLLRVKGDENKLKQVFMNLLLNAVEAGEGENEKGITINAQNIEIPDKETQPPLQKGEYVKVSIEDKGGGISREHLDKVFDPYFTTKEKGSKKGMGLGLTICYSIVRKHKGHIAVISEEGKGTSVEVYLPVFPIDETTTDKIAALAKSYAGRVLVMDDDPVVQDVTGQMLKRLGYEVEIFDQSRETVTAYGKAMKTGNPFDFVLLDLINKHDIGGRETLKELLKLDPHIKAIAISGFSNDAEIELLKKDGFLAVLFKPYKMADLQEVLTP